MGGPRGRWKRSLRPRLESTLPQAWPYTPRSSFTRAEISALWLLPRAYHGAAPRLLIAANRRGDACAGRNAQSLIEKNFFKRGQDQQHVGILAGVAHQSNAPYFSFHRTKTAGNFDVEFVQ